MVRLRQQNSSFLLLEASRIKRKIDGNSYLINRNLLKERDQVNIIDKLLESPCYIMDFLPKQVPMNCSGQFFEVETYLLNHYDCCGLRDRFIGVILKAMCYYPVSVQWGKWIEQPTPEQVTKIIDTILESHSGDVNILFTSKDVLLQFDMYP